MFSTYLLVLPAVLAAVRGSTRLNDTDVELSVQHFYPEAHLTTPELVMGRGYPIECHTAVTDDGYILTIHRIPHGKSGPSPDRPAVFLLHGLSCTSAQLLISESRKALGFVLADAGYDVWLGNCRGNSYSNQHTTLKNTSEEFWQFSWHESGVYDVPAMIDYIIENTGQKQLYYVGHSMGNTIFFVMASMRPEYNAKIRAHFGLAPTVFVGNMKSPFFKTLSPFENQLELLRKTTGVNKLALDNKALAAVGAVLCGDGATTQHLCSNFIFTIAGHDKKQLNTSLLPVLPGHFPSGLTMKQLLHYAQQINTGKFRQYDYGAMQNLQVYGSLTPPDYDLSKVTSPAFLFWSDNDWIVTVKDVKKLEKKLPNVKESIRVPYEKFNHIDFVWAIDVVPLVFNKLLALMKTN